MGARAGEYQDGPRALRADHEEDRRARIVDGGNLLAVAQSLAAHRSLLRHDRARSAGEVLPLRSLRGVDVVGLDTRTSSSLLANAQLYTAG